MCNKPQVITLRPSTYAYYLKRDGQVKCVNCGLDLIEGSQAVSRIRGTGGLEQSKYNGQRSTHRILYCCSCSEALNIK